MGTLKKESNNFAMDLDHRISYIKDKDYVLKWLISSIEEIDLAFNITLNLKGAVISGEMIGEKEYAERLNQYFRDCIGITDASEMNLNRFNTKRDLDSNPLSEEYIHLKNAKVFFSSIDTAPLEEGVLWRGKLSSVDGYMLGLFRSYP
jgi:hypothetical protein